MFFSFKREIISGISGGLVFSAVYILGGHLAISLICGSAVFLFAYILWRGDAKKAAVTTSGGSTGSNKNMVHGHLERLVAQMSGVADEKVRYHMAEIIENASRIAAEGEKPTSSPGDIKIYRDLATYYLPSLCGVMDKYTEIVRNNVRSAGATEFKKRVATFLAELDTAFGRQLDAMLSDDMTDASLEMDVVKNILKSDGFMAGDDFTLRRD